MTSTSRTQKGRSVPRQRRGRAASTPRVPGYLELLAHFFGGDCSNKKLISQEIRWAIRSADALLGSRPFVTAFDMEAGRPDLTGEMFRNARLERAAAAKRTGDDGARRLERELAKLDPSGLRADWLRMSYAEAGFYLGMALTFRMMTAGTAR